MLEKPDLQKQHISFTYDGTFEGLLTCVFEAFDRKQFPQYILKQENSLLFTENYIITTDKQKANRVIEGLKKKISPLALKMLFCCWLSEIEEVEIILFNYICKSFTASKSIELNFADNDVLTLSKIYQKVGKEAERMRQFVRFQKTTDQIYFASIKPLYNVLPLVADFFQNRFADQQWIIYDIKRNYALYYNLQKVETVYFEDLKINRLNGKLQQNTLTDDEQYFQNSWKEYIKSISIKERKNLRQQKQFMPKRFWKYLTEKQS